jgi:hypothetical protein
MYERLQIFCDINQISHARSIFHVVRVTLAKFGLHAGNMKFDTPKSKGTAIPLQARTGP